MKLINKILCVVEPDDSSLAAITHAFRIAEEQQAQVSIVSTIAAPKGVLSLLQGEIDLAGKTAQAIANKQKAIQKWLKQHLPDKKTEVNVFSGVGFIEVINQVLTQQFDLVVKCANDVDWLARLFGSDDMQLLRKCPCPVLLLKPGHNEEFRHVMATVDVNDDINESDFAAQDQLNQKVMRYSASFALPESTAYHIASCWEAYGEDYLRSGTFYQMDQQHVDGYATESRDVCSERIEKLVNQLAKIYGEDALSFLRPSVYLVKGEPAQQIPQVVAANHVDLLVMGTVARTGIPGFIVGNTAESILEQVQCSVLAVKPDGFTSPVQG